MGADAARYPGALSPAIKPRPAEKSHGVAAASCRPTLPYPAPIAIAWDDTRRNPRPCRKPSPGTRRPSGPEGLAHPADNNMPRIEHPGFRRPTNWIDRESTRRK
jgi:hypothetical protein